MSNQTIGVNLKFSADVTAAKRAMGELQGQLQNITNISANSNLGTKFSADLNTAQQAASQLRMQLSAAFNQDTGKLNLAKFTADMQRSGMSIQKYKQQLSMLGPEGQKAFNQLAYNVSIADTRVRSLSGGLQRLGSTFMNTLRYQLSSSIIMGFIQGIGEAINYTKELNESLNNIRIVTSYGVEEMKNFAAEATKAAKVLSTTTKSFTDASLIYFQQGLNMQEAQKRAETTIKLANVTGQSVQQVSDQLTAIWNNFYDGSKALEYYADVVTALGAATASSSDEISEGLQKFAAIANTVGLSYEYATAALATVTATTRQSADVVGTAFKTLFARIQDLELGETLDDGVTLGKYSEGLAAIGVNILDANSNLKDMNIILDEMGSKWDTLSKAQQVSVAQTVAGVRQYSQLIALMDNWSYFQENLGVAEGSSGELQDQADIYAESWDAAANRVKASLEEVFNSLLNDEAFIDMMDTLAGFIEIIGDLATGLGGLPGILSMVALALTRTFSSQIISGANNLATSMMSITPAGQKRMAEEKAAANAALFESGNRGGFEGIENSALARQATTRQAYNANKNNMDNDARGAFELRMDAQNRNYDKYFNSENYQRNKGTVAQADKDRLQQRLQTKETSGAAMSEYLDHKETKFKMENGRPYMQTSQSIREKFSKDKRLDTLRSLEGQETITVEQNQALLNQGSAQLRQAGAAQELNTKFNIGNESALASLSPGSNSTTAQASQSLMELESRLKSIGMEGQKAGASLKDVVGNEIAGEYEKYADQVNKVKQALQDLEKAEANSGNDSQAARDARTKYESELEQLQEREKDINAATETTEEVGKINAKAAGATDEFINSEVRAGQAVGETAREVSNLNQQSDLLEKDINKAGNASLSFGQKVQQSAQLAMSLGMAMSAIKGAIDVLNNDDMSFGEKLISIMMSLGMAIPMVISSLTSMKGAFKGLKAEELKSTIGKIANAAATRQQAAEEHRLGRARQQNTGHTQKQTIAEKIQTLTRKGKNGFAKTKGGFSSVVNTWNENALKASGRYKFDPRMGGTGRWVDTKDPSHHLMVSKDTALKGAGKDALKGVGKSVGKAGITVAAIAAAIAIGKTIYDAADNLYNRDEKAAQRAEKAAKDLADTYQKATSKFNEMKTSMENYQKGLTSLKDLTKGTEQYEEAVDSANEEALKLINTYKELAGQYHTTAEGLIVFNEGALETVKILEKQRKAAALTASTFANQEAREARTQANTTQFLREDVTGSNKGLSDEDKGIIGKYGGLGVGIGAVAGTATTMIAGVGTIAGLASGAKLGAVIGSWAGPIGTAIGLAAGAAIGLTIGGIVAAADKKEATKNEKTAIETLSKAYDKMGSAALTPDKIKSLLLDKGITDPKLLESLNKNSDELEKLMKEIKANTEARKAENTNLARQLLTAEDLSFADYDSNIQHALSVISGNIMTKRQDEIDYKNKGGRRSESFTWGWNDGTAWGEKTVKEYLEAQGYTDVDAKNFKKNSVKVRYFDKEKNDYDTKEINYGTIAAWKEGQVISEEITQNYSKLSEQLINLAQDFGGKGLMTILGEQDVNNLTQMELESFKAAYKNGDFDSAIAELGEKTGKDYVQAINNAIDSWDYNTALTNYMRRTQSEIDSIFKSGQQSTEVSVKALENYSKSLLKNADALKTDGSALEEWQEVANSKIAAEMAVANAKFAKGVEKLDKALKNSLETLVNWEEGCLATWEAVAEIQTALEDVFGVKVSADFVKNNLIELQELAKGNTESLEELQAAAARDFVLNLDLAEEVRGDLVGFLNEAIQLAENEVDGISIDATLDDSSYIESLNKMLEAGDITKEQVQNMFGAIGYSVDIKTKKKKVENISKFSMNDPVSGKVWTGEIKNTSVMDVPYIAGENTEQAGEEFTTSTGETAREGYQENGEGFTYTGGRDLKAALLKDKNLEAAKIKKLDDVDKYHEEDQLLARLEKRLSNISAAKDRAFGKDRVQQIREEIKTLDAAIKVNEEYKKSLENDLKTQSELLNKNYGMDFDPNTGIIVDWEEQFQQKKDWYEGLMLSYAGTDQEDKIQQEYDLFVKEVEKYEEYLEKYYEKDEKVREDFRKKLDAQLEEIDISVSLDIEINDRELKRLEKLFDKMDDPIDHAVKKIGNLGDQLNVHTNKAASNLEDIQQVFSKIGVENVDFKALSEGDFSSLEGITFDAKALEAIKNYADDLEKNSEEIEQFYADVMQVVADYFAAAEKEMEKLNKQLDLQMTLLTSYRDTIDLIGENALGVSKETLMALSDAVVKASIAQTKGAKAELDSLKTSRDQIQQRIDDPNISKEEKKNWEKQLEDLDEKILDAESNLASAWKNTLSAINEEFKNSVDLTLKEFEKGIVGSYKTLEKMQEAYNQQKEISEQYVADYQKVYELSKLNRDINQALSKTDSVKNRQALLELQQEANDLGEEGLEISQYELDYLRKKYELRLAEIALEETLNAKSQVRMRRDSEGNWAYVYTADLEKASDAQQNYEDKLYEIMKFSQDYLDEMESMIIQNQRDMVDALRNLHEEDFATVEEYEAAKQRIIEYYTAKDVYLRGEMDKAISNSAEIYETDCLTYEGYTGKKINEDKRFRTQFTETFTSLNGQYKTSAEAAAAFYEAIEGVSGDLNTEFGKWKGFVKTACNEIGIKLDTWAITILPDKINTITGVVDGIGQAFKDQASDVDSGLKDIIAKIDENHESFDNAMQNYAHSTSFVTEGLSAILGLYNQIADLDEEDMTLPDLKSNWTDNKDGNLVFKTGTENSDNPSPTSPKKPKEYYGTYYDPTTGKLRHTTQIASSVEEAKQLAEKEAMQWAINTANEAHYLSSRGEDGGVFKNSTALDVYKNIIGKGKFGAQEVDTNTIRNQDAGGFLDSKGGHNEKMIQVDTKNGYKVWISEGNFELSKSPYDGWATLELIGGDGVHHLYHIGQDTAEQIVQEFGDKYSGSAKSGSGDFVWEDPMFEVGDKLRMKGNDNYVHSYFYNTYGDLRTGIKYGLHSPFDTILEIEDMGKGKGLGYFTGLWACKDNSVLNSGLVFYDGRSLPAVVENTTSLSNKELIYQWADNALSKVYFTLGNDNLESYDTGGYTGEWDSSGRLAMLHQKEIVLNAHDTENFLAAVNIVRDIASAIDLRAAAYEHQLAKLAYPAMLQGATQTIQQDVTIHAEFPNVKERSEIEAAFDNLINRASQLANRKN